MACTYCRKEGHNILTCDEIIPCSFCGERHKAKNCPELKDILEENNFLEEDEEFEKEDEIEYEVIDEKEEILKIKRGADCVIYNIITGHPCNAQPETKKILNIYRKKYSSLRIGITNNPVRRFNSGYRGNYKEMHVIYKTSSERYVRYLEKYLIDEFWSLCDNERGGGGGPSANPPYYLYVVIN